MIIKADYSENFSFARMQNGSPAVRSIMIRNTGDEPLRDLRISISFDPAVSEEYVVAADGLKAGEKRIFDNIDIHLSSSFLSNLTEKISGHMTVRVEAGDSEICRESFPISVYPYDFWEGTGKAASLLPCFVVPNHPEVKNLTRLAAEKLSERKKGRTLSEYQSGDIMLRFCMYSP